MNNYKVIQKTADLWYKVEADLGEGPVWINENNELLWVDINKGKVHATNAKTKEDRIIYYGKRPSCILPISKDECIISDINKLVKHNYLTGKNIDFLDVDFRIKNVRFNDGKIDVNGNIWVGTMEMNVLPNSGNLYKINSDKKVSIEVKNVTISNGITWSVDNKTMYYIDTFDKAIYAFDFNKKSEISNKRIAIRIPEELGYPDGMTIDNKGNLWVAMWGGSSVICWNPKSGQLLKKISVDASNVTSCAFGGENMDILFITTAREGLSKYEIEKYPNSGSIFYIKMGFTDQIENPEK